MGRDIRIEAVTDTAQEREVHEVKQSGLTVSASNPVVSAAQTGAKMADAASRSGDPVMQALALGTTALAAVNAVDAVAQNGGVGGVSINISLGSSKSQTTIDRSSSSVLGSNVAAGNDLTLVARGGGSASDITVTGSNLSAGNNAVLKADGDILLQAAQNLASQQTKNKSSSASVGVGITLGVEGGGVSVNAGMSSGRGNSDGRDSTWTQSTVTAGNVLALQSGGDTSLRGAVGQADQILAAVGGNLLLESLQDTSTYQSKQSHSGFSGSVCVTCAVPGSIAGNVGRGKMNSDYASVTQQTGLKAGDGGFLIDVGGNTTLIGSVISSSQQAVADGLNHLSTGTLRVEDIRNHAGVLGQSGECGRWLLVWRRWRRDRRPRRGRSRQARECCCGRQCQACQQCSVGQVGLGDGSSGGVIGQRQCQLDHAQWHQRRGDRDPRRSGPAGADGQERGGDDCVVEPGYDGYLGGVEADLRQGEDRGGVRDRDGVRGGDGSVSDESGEGGR
ncbi:hemagglutinin-like secreted protein [plant metagenome]|uniref:Hemagglutinin-like secreted protein n=1 Tax=plant metagenome TaxID=1297885 RepID=A0A484QMJ9_9ZZZZ